MLSIYRFGRCFILRCVPYIWQMVNNIMPNIKIAKRKCSNNGYIRFTGTLCRLELLGFVLGFIWISSMIIGSNLGRT